MKPIKKILVPTDFSEISRVGLKFAFSLVTENDADLLVLHVGSEFQVWEAFDEGTERGFQVPGSDLFFNDRVYKWEVDRVMREGHLDLNRFLEKHTEELCQVPRIRKKVVLGDVVERIVDVARQEEVDLIVMSRRPHGTLRRFFLGSVTDKVTRKAPCPVLSVCQEKQARPLREN